MADEIKVPGLKKPMPKWAVFGGLGVVGLMVYQYYRKKSSTAAADQASQAGSSTDQYPPDGTTGDPTDPYSTDPATGQTYGNEAAGSGGSFGAFNSPTASESGIIGYDSNGDPVYAPGYGPSGTGSGTGGPPFSNNADWTNWALTQMEANNPSINIGAAQNALGLYLQGHELNASERTYAFDAQAVAGEPPVAGPNGYPPKVRSSPAHKTSHQVTVPNVVRMRLKDAQAKLRRAGLKSTHTKFDHPKAAHYVQSQRPAANAHVDRGTVIHLVVGTRR